MNAAEPRPTLADVAELVRAPAVLTVLGDAMTGAAHAGHPFGPRSVALAGASALLYSAGMALNDYADADLDAMERPERPIPSGRISRRRALRLAGELSAGGLLLAGIAGRRHLAVAVPLTGLIWTYDLWAKKNAFGPAVMAACRATDVLMGAGTGHLASALPAAAVVGAHTASLTGLSRGEVHGTTTPVAAAAATTTAVVAAAFPVMAARRGPAALVPTLAAAGAYASGLLPAQARAARDPQAGPVRDATRAGIGAMVPLQAAGVASTGRWPGAVALGGVAVLGRVLAARRRRGDMT